MVWTGKKLSPGQVGRNRDRVREKSVKTANDSAIGRHVSTRIIMNVVEGTIIVTRFFFNRLRMRFNRTQYIIIYFMCLCSRTTHIGRCAVLQVSPCPCTETSVPVLFACVSLFLSLLAHISNGSCTI